MIADIVRPIESTPPDHTPYLAKLNAFLAEMNRYRSHPAA